MYTSGQKFESQRPAEVVFAVPRFASDGTGALAVKTSLEVVQDQTRELELELAQERARGRAEHLKAVFEGKEEFFRVYFVLGLDTHEDMHRYFVEELGLPQPTVADLSERHEPHAVLIENGIQLTRHSNVYEDGVAYDVTYETAPLES
jgi:hypothetical protein